MKKSRYRSLFTVHTTKDPRTGATRRQAVYTGTYYRIGSTGVKRVALAKRFTPGVALFVGVFLGYGLMDLPSTRSFLTLPFYVLMPLPLFYWGLSVVRIIRLPQTFTQVQREQSAQSCMHSAYGLMALCWLFAAGEAVLMLTGGAGDMWPAECAWALAMLVMGALCCFTARQAKALDRQMEEVP